MRALLPLVSVLLPAHLAQGCSGCTQLGAEDGVNIASAGLHVRGGSVSLELCNDRGCATAVQAVPGQDGGTGAWDAMFWFKDLQSAEFSDGPAKAVVDLRDAEGSVVAKREEVIESSWLYPNGEGCDGEDFLYGEMSLRPSDRV